MEERFWSKVNIGAPGECWEWQAASTSEGYGRFKVNGRLVLSHRLAYELEYGPIPEGTGYHGLVVRHRCNNPRCCNPTHLQLGTQQDNVHDAMAAGTHNKTRALGEAHGRAKLTTEQVLHIKELLAAGVPRSQIARAFAVSRYTVRDIDLGTSWGWLSPA